MPDIRFYNTLTHRLEAFQPIEPGVVTMYHCGPTVYDYAHIGNFKTFLFADVLRRFFELVGYDVQQVMNLTDVGHMTDDGLADGGGEDKMAAAAKRIKEQQKKESKKVGQAHTMAIENPDDPYQVAQFYIEAFLEDAAKLGMKIAGKGKREGDVQKSMPRATEFVESHMIPMIQRLIDREHAYVVEDGEGGAAVYFAVESFPNYGMLSGNTLDQLRGGAGGRVSQGNQAAKRHPGDFLLWKSDPTHLMKWDSPWGPGYPGWHIECSAMATAVLGREVIDIHTGGEDNIFPHHECEIAQSRGASGENHFARYWLHTRHLFVNGEKMSKSKGNFYTVRDVLEGRVTGRPVDPAVLRFEFIKSHYRAQSDFSAKGLEASAKAVKKTREAAKLVGYTPDPDRFTGSPAHGDHPIFDKFTAALADDLNTAGAIGVAFEFINDLTANPPADESARQHAADTLAAIDTVLGVVTADDSIATGFDPAAKAAALDAARGAKDFATADAIRAQLIAAGYDVKTTKDGTVAEKKLA